eukprot:3623852-Rhodomonas_salina.1
MIPRAGKRACSGRRKRASSWRSCSTAPSRSPSPPCTSRSAPSEPATWWSSTKPSTRSSTANAPGAGCSSLPSSPPPAWSLPGPPLLRFRPAPPLSQTSVPFGALWH